MCKHNMFYANVIANNWLRQYIISEISPNGPIALDGRQKKR